MVPGGRLESPLGKSPSAGGVGRPGEDVTGLPATRASRSGTRVRCEGEGAPRIGLGCSLKVKFKVKVNFKFKFSVKSQN